MKHFNYSLVAISMLAGLLPSLAQAETLAVTNAKIYTSTEQGVLTNASVIIEDGKITQPIKGATLIGNGPDDMHKISMVGNDLKLDRGVGVCGKDGQSVPVGVGQPSLKIDEITVGGTA